MNIYDPRFQMFPAGRFPHPHARPDTDAERDAVAMRDWARYEMSGEYRVCGMLDSCIAELSREVTVGEPTKTPEGYTKTSGRVRQCVPPPEIAEPIAQAYAAAFARIEAAWKAREVTVTPHAPGEMFSSPHD